MKNFWQKTKKNVTLGMAKAKDGISSKKKKQENETPDYVLHYDRLHLLQDQCDTLQRVLTYYGNHYLDVIRTTSEISGYFSELIAIDSEPYHTNTIKSKDANDHLKIYAEYLKNHYIPQNEIALVKLCQEQIAQLKIIKNKRKKNKVLLKQEEAALATARSKNKDVQLHEEKVRIRQEKFDRYHNDFIKGVSRLYENRMNYFGRAYEIYQFYILETIELQQKFLISNFQDFPFNEIRRKVPSLEEPPLTTNPTNLKQSKESSIESSNSELTHNHQPAIENTSCLYLFQPEIADDSDLSDDLYPISTEQMEQLTTDLNNLTISPLVTDNQNEEAIKEAEKYLDFE